MAVLYDQFSIYYSYQKFFLGGALNTELETLLNDISTELILIDDSNPEPTVDGIRDAILRLKEKCGVAPENARLVATCEYVFAQRKNLNTKAYIALINTFASQAQVFLKNPLGAILPGEEKAASASSETNGNVDPQFLVEFIEKHTGMMEEFEASLVELRYRLASPEKESADVDEARKDFELFAKGYIHNLKGDAGSVGLIGIEKTCHFVEDQIGETGASNLLDQLLSFKEWVVACMRAFSSQEEPVESSVNFQARFVEGIGHVGEPSIVQEVESAPVEEPPPAEEPVEQSTASAEKASSVSAALGEELPPEANVDLLAELLAEGVMPEKKIEEAAPEEEKVEEVPATESQKSIGQEPDTGTGEFYTISGDMEVFIEFCVEAEDHLNIIESILLESEGNYTKDSIDSIFRGIHSIKGASSYFCLKEMTESSHKTETLLDEVRDGKRVLDQALAELVLAYVDLQHRLINKAREAVKADGKIEACVGSRQYLERLSVFQSGTAPASEAPRVMKFTAPAAAAAVSVEKKAVETPTTAQKAAAILEKSEEAEKAAPAGKGEKLEVKNFVKIDTQRLDLLIDSIGEMCIYSSMLVQSCRELIGDNERILKTTHQVEKFSRDLQNIGMSMRLIPIRGLFQKMSRLVWDTAKKIGKEVKFQMYGEETELDRSIIDKLADPLMHMVRNALDHGIEPPDEREAAGKSRSGTITLSASHAGGSIHIKVEDDGRGLIPEKLVKKAIEKGLIPENHSLNRSEIFNLIFAPGFSTAAVVTDISGRGVGMDVVKRNIETMRGRVHIESEEGKGSSFLIELPLTLAIIDGIQVACGGENFIIPTLSVIEFMRPSSDSITRTLDRGETYQFRGRYLPVYRLAQLFGVAAKVDNPEESIFVIVESGGQQVAIMVDEIIGTYSTIIKSIGDMFDQGKGVAGCAIMANGDVALILDIRSMIQMARAIYVFEGSSPVIAQAKEADQQYGGSDERQGV